MRTKPYVGIKKDGTRELFQASAGPTQELYGQRYNAVIGPFRTVRGAKFMRDHGANNPHCQHVNEAERLAGQKTRTNQIRRERVKCDQCEALMINGVFCHETGCPNTRARWDSESQTWIKQRKCFDCGCTVDSDDPCCSAPFEETEEENS